MTTRRVESSIECILPGHRIQLPIVRSLASLHSRSASRIPWHSHEVFELLYLLDGATEYEFRDGQAIVLPGGHFLVVRPGIKHRGLQNVRRPARLCSILLDGSQKKGLSHTIFTHRDWEWLFSQIESAPRIAWPMGSELRKLAAQLAGQVRDFGQDERKATSIRLTVCGMLLETARQLTLMRTIPSDEAVRAAIRQMEALIDQAFSISDIARAIGCSRARLFAIFKEATGLTPNDYLQRMRVTKAASLLQETDLSITQVAMKCGFNTSQYFSNVFRKYHNRTPTEVRDSRRKKMR